jgi:hypothetical protein
MEAKSSRKGAEYTKAAKKRSDFHCAFLCAVVRQPTDELF